MSSKIEFETPKGLDLGETAKDGESVELMATFKLKNGKLCLTKIEDVPMKGYDKEGKDEPEPEDKGEDFTERYETAMAGEQPMMQDGAT